MHLSYASDSFDLVLHSETLEHVPDVCRALDELWRVLRPGGLNVFTIPVLWDRLVTRRRAQLESGVVKHILPPSYHGTPDLHGEDRLVFYEFGSDIVRMLNAAGFDVAIRRHPSNIATCTFVTRKRPRHHH